MFTVLRNPRLSRLRIPLLRSLACLSLAAALLGGCDGSKAPAGSKTTATADDHGHDHDSHEGHSHDDGHDHGDEEAAQADIVPPGTVPIPAQVRQNLGITFANVEMRRVESTIRVPGRFEPLPRAVREYHAPLAGRVELLVHQYDRITTGMPLYRLDSSEWRRMQQELLTAEAEVMSTSASLRGASVAVQGGVAAEDVTRERIEAADAHIRSLESSVRVAEDREKQALRLHEIMGGRLSEVNEARTQLASLRNELSQAREDRAELSQQRLQLSTETGGGGAFGTTETLEATLMARRAEYEAAKARRDLLRASLMSITSGLQGSDSHSTKTWTIEPEITVRALTEGRVSEINVTNGAYLDTADKILTTVNPNAVRFRAVALQSDILRLGENMAGRIIRPGTAGTGEDETIPVNVTLGLEADPEERTLDVIAEVHAEVPWARPGLSTDLELVLDDTEDPETAIPVAAVIQDGLDKVFFRRNPNNLDQAVRVKADLGMSDGRWVVVYSGVKAGDQVVLDGVYELKLATADAPAKAGHFHADGTFHEGDD